MMRSFLQLFFSPSRDRKHQRRQQAAVAFALLWAMSMLFIVSTTFLLFAVQSLVLLNTAASLVAAVVTQSLCGQAGVLSTYPFGFGFYRLRTVVGFGSVIFLVFGCVSTVVEALHLSEHDHHSNPFLLLSASGVNVTFYLLFRQEVCLADRVVGYRGIVALQSEEKLYHACVAASSERMPMGGGGLFQELGDGAAQAVSTFPHRASPISSGASPPAPRRRPWSTVTALVRYLLCPLTCIVVSVLIMVTESFVLDTVGTLLLALYYGVVGYRRGRAMLDLLMNKCVTEPGRLRSLERCLRNVRMMDGVLHVHSTVWWSINACESMLLIRVRLMSGVDACAVSQAVRMCLIELATAVYVECFPACGIDGFGDSAPLTWNAPSRAAQGSGHDLDGHKQDHWFTGDHDGHEACHGHSHADPTAPEAMTVKEIHPLCEGKLSVAAGDSNGDAQFERSPADLNAGMQSFPSRPPLLAPPTFPEWAVSVANEDEGTAVPPHSRATFSTPRSLFRGGIQSRPPAAPFAASPMPSASSPAALVRYPSTEGQGYDGRHENLPSLVTSSAGSSGMIDRYATPSLPAPPGIPSPIFTPFRGGS